VSPPASEPAGAESQAEAPVNTSAAGELKIPVFRAGRSLLVHARLNDEREVKLIVDTGADLTILSSSVVRDLGLGSSAGGQRVTLSTAGGSVQADLIRVPRVAVGTAEATNVSAAVHDLPDAPGGADGLLGLSFLEKFLVTLDAQKGELSLRARP
jgi:clan AA aspartic protease (TIGR02281 family)